jgi:hypothetical protein
MSIRSLAALALTVIASSAAVAGPADSKCGAGSCGKKTKSVPEAAGKDAACSKKDSSAKEASCSKKDASCSKKEAACSKKDHPAKEAACSKKEASCSKK